jgi:hypothetical protein
MTRPIGVTDGSVMRFGPQSSGGRGAGCKRSHWQQLTYGAGEMDLASPSTDQFNPQMLADGLRGHG